MSRYPSFMSAPLLVAMKPITFDTFPAKPLFGYVTRLLSPSYSVASCRCWFKYFTGSPMKSVAVCL